MLIKRPDDLKSSEITSERDYRNRRAFMTGASAVFLGGLAACKNREASAADKTPPVVDAPGSLVTTKSTWSTDEKPTSFEDVTTYNNFYEFGLDKSDPSKNAGTLKTRPWTVAVEGAVAKPGTIGIEEVLRLPLEERIYRHRCVEAWSMVIPWVGVPLSTFLKRFEPTSAAKYVEFTTLVDTAQMPYQKTHVLDWPYIEGLRIDEAMHPLAILSVGLYGKVLPNQNGAPIRLV
ncbi:MAG TPA: protein-methionine-sulfoxide reductase catalytic subunit MsrP, partial [bacterium]|nr:protein-methionine-sulfoxide reductase catalytic subunit MsrP [bacterium]